MIETVKIELGGNVAGVLTLPKQLKFAGYRTTNELLERAQMKIVRALHSKLHIRGNWLTPGTKYGVNVRFAKRTGVTEGSVGTNADWLLEEEGYNHGVKKVDHGNRGKGIHLAQPDVGNARPTLMSVMPRSQKAGKLLANPQRTKAFKVRTQSGKLIVLQRVGKDASGNILRDSRGHMRIGRKSERKGGTSLVLKAVLRRSVRVPQTQVFIKSGTDALNVRRYGVRYRVNLLEALRTAKMPSSKK